MKFPLLALVVFITTSIAAQTPDSTRKPRKVRIGAYSSASYQVAVNGNSASTNLGNFAFKGYVQPEIGLGVRYQQDSTEFATVTLSASRLVLTLASSNVIFDNGNEYPITNRIDVYMNNYSLEAAYHRRISKTKGRHFWSLECGAGVHVLQWYSAGTSIDTVAGPYKITRSINSGNPYVLPSAMLGINTTILSAEHKNEFIIGLRGQLYLGKFSEIKYEANYTSPDNTLNYYFRWSPVILTPKVYVMLVF